MSTYERPHSFVGTQKSISRTCSCPSFIQPVALNAGHHIQSVICVSHPLVRNCRSPQRLPLNYLTVSMFLVSHILPCHDESTYAFVLSIEQAYQAKPFTATGADIDLSSFVCLFASTTITLFCCSLDVHSHFFSVQFLLTFCYIHHALVRGTQSQITLDASENSRCFQKNPLLLDDVSLFMHFVGVPSLHPNQVIQVISAK